MKSIFLGKPVVYVARDLERGLGLPLSTRDYYIISNFSAFGKRVAGARKNVLLIKSKRILDTHELLNHPEAKRFINRVCHSDRASRRVEESLNVNLPQILVFKPTSRIEKICTDNNWTLLNPSAKLAARVEEKISQVEWLGPLARKFLPPFEIKECEKIKWAGKKFILQFNFAHTGQGTLLVESGKQLDEIKKKFPVRPARVTKYIVGPMFTNNNVVWGGKLLVGNINYQITGLKPFTNNPFATIGNDWALPHKILTNAQKKQYETIARAVGERLSKSGWKGLFGIDVITEEATGKLYLIEINARQSASTSYESELQAILSFRPSRRRAEESLDAKLVTTFQAHLLSLLGAKYSNQKLIKIKNGAQVVQKVGAGIKKIPLKQVEEEFSKKRFGILAYNNTKPESDQFRFQTFGSLMAKHNKFNKYGEFLLCYLQKRKKF